VAILKDTSHYHTNAFADTNMNIIIKMLTSWPVQMLFPVFDIMKMMIYHPHGANLFVNFLQSGNEKEESIDTWVERIVLKMEGIACY
jgi:phospholipase A-2-activating protein